MGKEKMISQEAAGGSLLRRIYINPYFRFLLFGLALSLFPVCAEAGIIPVSYLTLMGGVLVYSVVGLGLNLLLGYSGMISLGTAGFMGLGAYVTGYVTAQLELPWLLALALAILIASFIGILVGLVSLRVAGIYLAIATLCVSEILRKCYEELEWFTNGFSGRQGVYPTILGIELNRTTTFLLATAVLALMMMLTYNLVNGQLGRAMHAMRGSEVAAQAMGINLLKYRLIVFAAASAYATLGGVLYMSFIRYSNPVTWVLMLSLNILAAVVIGGLRSIYGTVFGAFVVYAIPDMLLKRIPGIGEIEGLSYVFSGLLIILVIMFYPNGLKGIPAEMKRLAGAGRKEDGKGGKRNGEG